MTYKTNTIEDDLIKAFKVFETNDDDGTVKRDEIKNAFSQFIEKKQVSNQLLKNIFTEIMPQTDSKGNIDYKELVRTMLKEPDPLALPKTI